MSSSYLKSAGNNLRRKLSLAILAALSGSAYGLPEGGQVITGDVNIDVAGGTMDVQQHTDRAVLEFDQFDVASGETVNFIQPDSDSVVLNRVVGNELSEIHGAINANGHVFLINTNGVLFGNEAQINVGGLLVSTLDLANEDFLQGRYDLEGTSAAGIVNQGSLRADGDVELVAANIENQGLIAAADGAVTLRAPSALLVTTPGSDIPILVEDTATIQRIVNRGELRGERVRIDAQVDTDALLLANTVIENSGLIRAVSARGDGGEIELLANGADVIQAGTLDVSTVAEGGKITSQIGGKVAVQAGRFAQMGEINADGAAGGGDVTIHTEQTLVMHGGSSIHADAGQIGAGGDIRLVAESDTWFRSGAAISARGGEVAGDGGFVEVSGHQFIDVQGLVDVGATRGEAGLWYIDPTSININSNGVNNGSFTGSDPFVWDLGGSPPADAQIDINTIINTLRNNGDVLIDTASAVTGAGDISFAANLNFDAFPQGRTLRLVANRDINFQGGFAIVDASPGSEGLSLDLSAGRNILMNTTFVASLGSGTFTAQAGGDITVTSISTNNASDQAIYLHSLNGALLDDGLNASSLIAPNGGLVAIAATGIGSADQIETNVSRLGLANTLSGTVQVNVPGDLTVTGLGIGGNSVIDINVGGTLSYLGTTLGELDGGAGGQINLTVGGAVNFSGQLADTIGAVDHDVDFVAVTGAGFFMADGAVIQTGTGGINISATTGGAAVTGLTSNSSGANAIVITTTSGSLLDAGDSNAVDMAAPLGGLILSIADGVMGLETSVQQLDVASSNGDVQLNELDGLVATNLSAADLVDIQSGGDFQFGASAILSANRLRLNSGGVVTIPDAGLSVVNTLDITANDMVAAAGGRAVSLTAPTLNLATAAVGGDLVVNSTATSLSVRNFGANAFIVQDVDTLVVADAQPLSGNLIINSGVGSDLVVNNDIDMDGYAGGLVLNAGANLQISANIADLTGPIDHDVDYFLTAVDDILFAAGSRVESGAGNVALSAGGGVTLGAVSGTWVALSAGTQIVDGNGAAANITADLLTLTAATGVGSLADGVEGTANTLSLIGSVGDVFYQNSGDMVLTDSEVAGDLNIALVGSGNLTVEEETPGLTGNLAIAIADGDFIIGALRYLVPNGLTLSARNILDDLDSQVALSAASANITLLGGGVDTVVTGDFDDVTLQILGSQSVTLNDSNDLTVSGLSSGGDLVLSAGNHLTLTDAAPALVGALTLSAAADLLLPSTGLAVTGNLTLNAANIDDGDSTINVSADHLAVNLAPSAATTFLSSVNSANLSVSGGQTVTLTETDGLSLTGLASAGDVNINLSAGDLTLTTALLSVAGSAAFTTAATNQIILMDAGLAATGELTLDTGFIHDTDNNWSLTASQATVIERNALVDSTLNTAVDGLTLQYNGGGRVDVVDADALSLVAITADADASFTSTDADLTLIGTLLVGGALSLNASGNGDIVVPVAGLTHGGDLNLSASNIRDGDNRVTLAAAAANLALRSTSELTVDSTLSSLILANTGVNSFTLVNQGALVITDLASNGDVAIATENADLTLADAATAVAGDLNLATVTAGDLIIPVGGLLHGQGLTLDADHLTDGDASVTLAATNLDVNLRQGDVDTQLITVVDSVALAFNGTNTLTLNNTGALLVQALQSAGDVVVNAIDGNLTSSVGSYAVLGALTFTTQGSGNWIVADSGFQHAGQLTVQVDDIVDSDQDVILSAATADILVRGGGADRSWLTSFDQFALNNQGAGALTVTDTDALTVNTLQSAGDLALITGGDLTLNNDPAVAGLLSLNTLNSGVLRLSDSGLNHGGMLVIDAMDVVDSDTDVSVTATSATVQLRDHAGPATWATDLSDLTLTVAGSGALRLNNAQALLIANVISAGDFTVSAPDLTIAAASLGSDVSLLTASDGVLQVPVAGILTPGTLLVDAGSATDVNGLNSSTWQASAAQFNLRDINATAGTLNVSAADLAVASASVEDLILNLTGATALNTLSGGGNVSVLADSNVSFSTLAPAVVGELAIVAAQDVTLPSGGFTVSNPLRLQAQNLLADDGGAVALNGSTADITLSGSQALTLNSSLTQLALSFASPADLTLVNDTALNLVRLNVPNAASLVMDIDGTLTLPNTGVAVAGSLAINAWDVFDTDRELDWSAQSLIVQLSNASGDNTWHTNVAQLDVQQGGFGSLTVDAPATLTLADLNSDGTAVRVDDGNFTVLVNGGDLRVSSDITVADVTADGQAAGRIQLSVAAGDLSLGSAVAVSSTNLVDNTNFSGSNPTYAIELNLLDGSQASRGIYLGNDSGAATLTAVGGDIRIQARGISAPAQAPRLWVQSTDSVVSAYNDVNDPLNGLVFVNGNKVVAEAGQQIHSGRALAILADLRVLDIDEIFDDVKDLVDPVTPELDTSSTSAAKQFEKVFGGCDELDSKNQHRCRVDSAVKAFLSHWLVGGEMPPKSEVR